MAEATTEKADISTGNRRAALGFAAAFAACLIGAGWQIATRSGVATTLSPIDLALLRYSVPGLVLMPVWIRLGLFPRGIPKVLVLLMILGAGLPFGLTAMAGAKYAPVAHMGALLPGAMPLFVAVMAACFLGEKFSLSRAIGAAAIAIGIGLVSWGGLSDVGATTWLGDSLFLLAAVMWAVFTVAFRRSGLSAWQGTSLVSGWSLVLVIPIWLLVGGDGLTAAPIADIAVQFVWQGIAAGLVGVWIYGFAISAIGASRAAAIGALVPGMVAVGGWLLLHEAVDVVTAFGVAATSIGVAVSTGLGARKSKS